MLPPTIQSREKSVIPRCHHLIVVRELSYSNPLFSRLPESSHPPVLISTIIPSHSDVYACLTPTSSKSKPPMKRTMTQAHHPSRSPTHRLPRTRYNPQKTYKGQILPLFSEKGSTVSFLAICHQSPNRKENQFLWFPGFACSADWLYGWCGIEFGGFAETEDFGTCSSSVEEFGRLMGSLEGERGRREWYGGWVEGGTRVS